MDLHDFAKQQGSAEPTLLTALRRASWQRTRHGRLMTDVHTGQVISMVTRMVRPKTALELGTFTGYGTLCLAEGLAEDGTLHTVERNDELFALQDEFWKQHKRYNAIVRHHGQVADVLAAWPLEHAIDLAYIDADKQGVNEQLDALLPLMVLEAGCCSTIRGGTARLNMLRVPSPTHSALSTRGSLKTTGCTRWSSPLETASP